MNAINKALSVGFLLEFARPYLNDDAITEVCVNRPRELWAERVGVWECHAIPDIDLSHLNSVATAVASFNGGDVSEVQPILSAVLPSGERIQLVRAPACESDTVSLTIRKPNHAVFNLSDYKAVGFFDAIQPVSDSLSDDEKSLLDLKKSGNLEGFLTLAVQAGLNIVVAGETGSGKTTLMKSLAQIIPADQRIVTIEDVHELFLPSHPNHVHLFYQATASHGTAETTPTDCLKSCLRMKPDRILLAELRGSETADFLNVCASGHGGSITSCHAGSCALTFERLALMAMQAQQGLPYEVIRRLLSLVVDVVVHVTHDSTGRHISDVWYDPESKQAAA